MKLKLYFQLTYLRDRFGFLSGPIDAIRYSGFFDEYFNEMGMKKSAKHKKIDFPIVLAATLGIFCGGLVAGLVIRNEQLKPCREVVKYIMPPVHGYPPTSTPTVAPTTTPTPTPTTTPTLPRKRGMASYYSRVGCVGCSKTLTMANGQPLDDSALTVAYNHAPMGTKLMITNVKNGQTVTAVVTDTGGFGKLNRIADMTIATRDAIGCSNLCEVEIVEL